MKHCTVEQPGKIFSYCVVLMQVFAWGCGPCLGTGSVDSTSARPRIIDELQSTSVIDIAAGDSHCLALSKG